MSGPKHINAKRPKGPLQPIPTPVSSKSAAKVKALASTTLVAPVAKLKNEFLKGKTK